MAVAGKAPTLTDVAKLAGVSRATVSRVVNESKHVEPEVAQRVRKAVQELGYVPNHAARSLITQQTDMVALIAGEPNARFFHDPFFEGISRGAAQELGEVDMRLLMLMIQTPDDLARVQRYLLGRPVDGVLVISEHWSNRRPGRAPPEPRSAATPGWRARRRQPGRTTRCSRWCCWSSPIRSSTRSCCPRGRPPTSPATRSRRRSRRETSSRTSTACSRPASSSGPRSSTA